MSDLENPRVQNDSGKSSEIYRLTRSEILAACAILLTLIGGAVRLTRDTSGDSERQANRVRDELSIAIKDSEARSRALITDLETRTTKALGDAEARTDRQINQTVGAINKRLDANDAQITQLAKGKRW